MTASASTCTSYLRHDIATLRSIAKHMGPFVLAPRDEVHLVLQQYFNTQSTAPQLTHSSLLCMQSRSHVGYSRYNVPRTETSRRNRRRCEPSSSATIPPSSTGVPKQAVPAQDQHSSGTLAIYHATCSISDLRLPHGIVIGKRWYGRGSWLMIGT